MASSKRDHRQDATQAPGMAQGPDVAQVAIKALTRVFAAWGLRAGAPSTLAGVTDRTWSRMKKGDWSSTMSQDQITRASALVGLYKGLHLYFGDPLADEWVGLVNKGPLFQGQSPLAFMLEGGIPAICATRNYVDAIRGGV